MTRFAALLIMLAFLPTLAFPQAGKEPAKVDPAKLRAKLLSLPSIDGQFTKIDREKKEFTFEYIYQLKMLIPEQQLKLADVTRRFQLALAMQSTSLDAVKKLQAEGIAAEKAAYKIVDEVKVPFELGADDNLVVRTLVGAFNPDGTAKKVPGEPVKGKAPMPGLPATVKDLSAKKWVRVYLDKAKANPLVGKGTEATVHPLKMIVIIPDPPPSATFVIPGS
jgi:hypothetical protein